jgi:prevent-host-death family protein
MSIAYLKKVKSVKSLEDLKAQPRKILSQIRRSDMPVLITRNGKPDFVIQKASAYDEEYIKQLQRLLDEAEESYRAGRVRPLEEFLKELERGEKISSHSRRRRRA